MNIEAAKAVADAIRTSLGPRGMDKMVGVGGRRTALQQLHYVSR
jgi:chaperonin GroEL (HSP60 family)